MKNLLSIGEMAKYNDITIQRLRYYDNIGLLSPAKTDSDTGYRYYTKEQVRDLENIQRLQYAGFKLAEIKSLYENQDTLQIESFLFQKLEQIEERQNRLKRRKTLIQKYIETSSNKNKHINDIQTTKLKTHYIAEIPSQTKDHIHQSLDEYLVNQKNILNFLKSYNISRGCASVILLEKEKGNIKQSLCSILDVNSEEFSTKKINAGTYYFVHCNQADITEAMELLSNQSTSSTKLFYIEKLPDINLNQKQARYRVQLRKENE